MNKAEVASGVVRYQLPPRDAYHPIKPPFLSCGITRKAANNFPRDETQSYSCPDSGHQFDSFE